MKKYIVSSRILLPDGFVSGGLEVEDGIIKNIHVGKECKFCEEAEVTDYGDNRVIPGIIDIHNHGFGGWSMTDPATKDDVKGFVKAVASIGVTGVLPTANESAFEAVADCMDDTYVGAKIWGIHSEGPFWARGGENTVGETWPLPSVPETERLVEKAKNKMVLMALAPEQPGAYDVIRYLHKKGIKVSCAHTKAHSEEIQDAYSQVGFESVTHLCNGMRGIHHRDAGTLGAVLLLDGLKYELITDLNHVCADMIKLLFKIQPYTKFMLISDSNYIAGLPTGKYIRYNKLVIADEKGLIKDLHGRICGSGKYVLYNMGQLVNKVGVPFEEVSKMASKNPAVYLGIDNETGTLETGKRADITVVDDAYQCLATYVGGDLVFEQQEKESVLNKKALANRIAGLDEMTDIEKKFYAEQKK